MQHTAVAYFQVAFGEHQYQFLCFSFPRIERGGGTSPSPRALSLFFLPWLPPPPPPPCIPKPPRVSLKVVLSELGCCLSISHSETVTKSVVLGLLILLGDFNMHRYSSDRAHYTCAPHSCNTIVLRIGSWYFHYILRSHSPVLHSFSHLNFEEMSVTVPHPVNSSQTWSTIICGGTHSYIVSRNMSSGDYLPGGLWR